MILSLSFSLSTEEIDKKLTAYRRGCKIWKMLIFCQVRDESAEVWSHEKEVIFVSITLSELKRRLILCCFS